MGVSRVVVSFDLGERIGVVTGGCTEKYARKVLQDKLKSETPFKGGWEVWLHRKDPNNPDDDHVFDIINIYARMAGYL